MTQVVTLGECLGVLSPDPAGPLHHTDRMRLDIAGTESNVAIGLSRLGHQVSYCGRVGDDELGVRIVRTLRGEGVDVSGLTLEPGAPTGLILKEKPRPGMVRVRYYRSASAGARLTPADVNPAAVARAAVLHVTGVTPALGKEPAAAVRAAVDAARTAGVRVSFDVNHRTALWPDRATARRQLTALARDADLLFASEDELDLVADALAAVPEVVVTKGASGASVWESGNPEIRLAAVPATVVDTVGAGDALVAGYLSGLLDGLPPVDRLARGTLLGACAVGSTSDWQGLPTRDELTSLSMETGDHIVR